MSTKETKTFIIETSPSVMRTIERFFALLHYNSRHGHSGIFGMSLDGDGSDKVTVSDIPNLSTAVSLTSSIGYDVELASNEGFYGKDVKEKNYHYCVRSVPVLLKGDEIRKFPSQYKFDMTR